MLGTAGIWDNDWDLTDNLLPDSWVPFLGQAHFGGSVKENINITIKGARHTDFSFNAEDWGRFGPDGLPRDLTASEKKQFQINVWTNQFMRILYRETKDDLTAPGTLMTFMATPGIEKKIDGSWTVDLEEFFRLRNP